MSTSEHDERHDRGDDGIVLRASSAKWMWVLIGCLAFAMFGVSLILGDRTSALAQALGWVFVALFGLCAIVAIRELRTPGSLSITDTDIEVFRRGRLTEFPLAECGSFSSWRNPSTGATVVVFDYAADGDTELARQNRQLMGGSRCLTDSYGLPTEALVDLLNRARAANRR